MAAAEVERDRCASVQLQPGLTPDEIRGILQSTALDLGPKGIDEQFGAGLADAEARGAVARRGRSSRRARILFAERWPEMPPTPFPSRQ